MEPSGRADEVLLALLGELRRRGYAFATPTPETHRRVISRPGSVRARDLRDIFGWNLPFAPDLLPSDILELLTRAGIVESKGSLLRSTLRVSSIRDALFLHSAFPTDARDSVFFGPDSYRFVDFIEQAMPRECVVRRLVDIGCGAGVGGIMAAALVPGARITLTDVNPAALRLAAINARFAGVAAELVEAERLDQVQGPVDLAIANPPYIADDCNRAYRDGGDMHGARLSLDWARETAQRLERGGRMLLYTGSAIVAGRDMLREGLERILPALGCSLHYREIDPDVFGEELERPAYRDVERIAVVGAVVMKA